MRTSDPTIANDIYGGLFVFGGRALTTGGRSPFHCPAPSRTWSEILYGFGWLRHLRAADTALARANARALVDDFLRNGDEATARRPDVAARRVISFLSQSPLILDGADHAFYLRFMRALGRDIHGLDRRACEHPKPMTRLSMAIALCYAGLCLEGYDPLARRATKILKRELDRQILADGGHISRNPRAVLDLLLDLLPLKQVFLARGTEPPDALLHAIDRMPPMLRLLRHGDGTLAHFNGMGSTPVDHLTTLLFYDEARASPLQRGTLSGYERMEADGTVLTMDVGIPPPVFCSEEAGAGCLSFELSSGVQRIVVNCGAPRGNGESLGQAARATAAHSTATLDDTSSARILGPRGPIGTRFLSWMLLRRIGAVVTAGPTDVVVERPEPLRLRARHDGYRSAFGVLHERRWQLSPDGDRLEGEDRLVPDAGAVPPVATLRFHLHPSIKVSRTQNGRAIMLVLANRETWQFDAGGREARLEESIYLAATDGARHSEQIVLDIAPGTTEPVRWRFEKLAKGAPR